MRKYHRHTLLYLHETIELGRGNSDEFTERFDGVYHPMMQQLGARLFALWESTPYNGNWPQVTVIWEIDAFADYARIGKAQARGGSHATAAAQWSAYLSGIGAHGEGRIMYAAPQNRNLAQLRNEGFTGRTGDPGDHADQTRQAGRLHPRTGAALRAVVGEHR